MPMQCFVIFGLHSPLVLIEGSVSKAMVGVFQCVSIEAFSHMLIIIIRLLDTLRILACINSNKEEVCVVQNLSES